MIYKKVISVLLCIALMMSVFAFSVFAEDNVIIVTPPQQTTFYQGIDWDYFNGKITLFKKDPDLTGTVLSYKSKVVTFDPHTYIGANMTGKSTTGSWSEGKNTMKITSTEFVPSTVYATIDVNFVGISEVSLENPPAKTKLYMGTDWKLNEVLRDVEITTLDLTGTKLSVKYKDSSVKEVAYPSTAISWSIGDVDSLYPGKNTLYITFCGYSLPFEVDFLTELPEYLLGDVNMDNKITSYDALLVLEYSTGSIVLDTVQLLAADVNKDGNVNSTDALYILQSIVGIITL